jgi:hypothetical protein
MSAVGVCQVAHDRQPEARAAGHQSIVGPDPRPRPVDLVEALEDARLVRLGDPDPIIALSAMSTPC